VKGLRAPNLGAMSQENVDVLRRSLEAFTEGDYEAALSCLAPKGEWEHNIGLGTPMEGTYRGHGEVRRLWESLLEAFEYAHFDIEDMRDLGDEALALGQMTTRGRGSGVDVVSPFGVFAEVRDGLIVRQRFFADRSRALEAAGLRE
jgi:ketosteroid isomerase-like protein